MWYNNKVAETTAHWSSGQDASLSRWKLGFDSRMGHQKKAKSNFFDLAFFIQAAGLVWHQCACALYGIAKGGWHHAQACIFVFLRLDSIRSRCEQFHAATSCGFHSRLKPWFGSERRSIWQEIYCLNIRSNWLARLQIFATNIKLIRIQYIRSKNLHQVFLPIYPKRNTPKALQTCFQNLKLLVKSAWKLKVGLN